MSALENDKWEKFAQEYCKSFNKKDAAVAAGYSPNPESAYTMGNELYNRPVIRQRIKDILAQRRKEYDITVDRILLELGRVAFADMTEIIQDFNGRILSLKSLDEIPKRLRPAIKKVSQNQFGVNIEFHDKLEAIEKLAKHLGFYELDNKQKAVEPGIYLPDNNRTKKKDEDQESDQE